MNSLEKSNKSHGISRNDAVSCDAYRKITPCIGWDISGERNGNGRTVYIHTVDSDGHHVD